MPLINFRTNLTSLRYGADRPGGGDSGQPFVQFPIEDASTPAAFRKYYEINRTSLDFPVRGGLISQLITGEAGVITSTIDRKRIEQFFKSAPRGKAFLDKQKGLQLSNPRLQVPNTISFIGEPVGNVFLPVTSVYNPINTLTQVQVMGTGAFINRHGAAPTVYENPRNTYAYIAGAPQNNTDVTNRLAILWATKLLNNTQFLAEGTGGKVRGIDPSLIDRMGISQFSDQIFNYQGGPGSVYGIGVTRISRATDTGATELLANRTVGFTAGGNPTPAGIQKPYSTIAMTYQQLAEQNTRTTNPAAPTLATIQDFRSQLPGNTPFTDYEYFNIAQPSAGDFWGLGIGNPGGPLTNSSPLFAKPGAVDLVNQLNPFYFNVAGARGTDPWTAAGNESKDIIKFAFECLSNDNSEAAIALIFRAFLEGQITDTNQASYNEFKYLGRGETFRTYQGFDRTIGFTFKIFAQTRAEMKPLYTKLNQLISQVYPDYSPGYNLMRGSVVRLTIGDYIYRMPGFIENVNVSIDNNNTPWEIQMYGAKLESDVAQLPQFVTVACTFKPIMDILPARVTNERSEVALIGNIAKGSFSNPITNKFTEAPPRPAAVSETISGLTSPSVQLSPSREQAIREAIAARTTNPTVAQTGTATQNLQRQVTATRRANSTQSTAFDINNIRPEQVGQSGQTGTGRVRRARNPVPAALRPPASTSNAPRPPFGFG